MKITPGDIHTYYKVFTIEDVKKYADLTGDFNPIHFDEDYTKNTQFKKPIIHGPLLLTFVTTLFAKEIPGPGSVYLGHELKFLAPVYPNETIKIELEVIEVNSKNHIFIKTNCFNEENIKVMEGTARLKIY
jgi:acyl dehydratase